MSEIEESSKAISAVAECCTTSIEATEKFGGFLAKVLELLWKMQLVF